MYLFLAALLHALATSVEGALASCLGGHLLASLLICGVLVRHRDKANIGIVFVRTGSLLLEECLVVLV